MMEATVPLSAAWRTDPGLVRSHNEDFVIVYEPESPGDYQLHGTLYIVADGVGGADAGEVASQYASERTLHHYLQSTQFDTRGARLIEAMQSANTDLRRLAVERDDSRRMATTMVAAAIDGLTTAGGHAYIGNVGDSRAYLWRDGVISQITRDQSLVARLVEEGALTAEEALRYPYKNVILYSLGSEKRPPIDLFEVELEPGDHLLLCSDGLTRHVSDEEIARIMAGEEPGAAVETMVRLARQRGGEDNITVAVIQYGPRAAEQATVPKMDAEAATRTIARPRPETQAVYQAAPVVAAAEPHPRMWPLLLAMTTVMIVIIFLLWLFIQQATAI